jgi:hypothetical protein
MSDNSIIGLTAIGEVLITLCASPYICNSPLNTNTEENTNRLETELKGGRSEALFSKFQLSCLLPSTSVLSQKLYHYQEIQTAYSQTDWMTSTKLFKLKLLHTLPQSLIDCSLCPYMKFIPRVHK